MNTRSLWMSLGFTALVSGGMLMTPEIPTPNPGAGPNGTYLFEFGIGPNKLLGTVTVHQNGTWRGTDQTDGGGVPGLQSRQTPWTGIWRPTRGRSTEIHGLSFNFDQNGAPTGTARMDLVMDWEPGYDVGHGVASQRFYALGQNPLDPVGGIAAPAPFNALPVKLIRMTR